MAISSIVPPVARLRPEFLVRLGISAQAKVLDARPVSRMRSEGTSRRLGDVGRHNG